MKKHNIIAAMLIAMALPAGAQQINPVTKAVLDGYENILKDDPNDYVTLYQRAVELYRLSQYDKAKADIQRALRHTPAKEKEWLAQENSLMADICIEQKDYEASLDYIRKALEINPDSYSDNYKLGNICLYLNRPEDAYKAFSSMQRLKSRSQEAYFGMAKAAIMLGRNSEAEALMKQAEEAAPGSDITYCRLGDLYKDMGQNENAAANYLIGFSMTDGDPRPLESLVALAAQDYDAVAKALDYSVDLTANKIPLYFLKANLALRSGNYAQAENAAHSLLKLPEGNDPGVYLILAQAQLAQNRPTDALASVEHSVRLSDSALAETVKADALIAAGRPAEASQAVARALQMDADYADAMLAGARASLAKGDAKDALAQLNSLLMVDAGNLQALLMRAYVNTEFLKEGKLGMLDYTRAAGQPADTFPDLAWVALAKARSGKKLDSDAIISEGLKKDDGALANYYSAVYYAQTGALDKAAAAVNAAKMKGFQNQFMLQPGYLPGLDLTPIRHLLK